LKILQNQTILIISPERWSHYPVSKQHYALALAKLGNRVYFLNPPSSKNHCYSAGHPNVSIVDYKPLLKGLNRFPGVFSEWAIKFETRRLLNFLDIKFQVVWSFDPFRFQHLRFFNCPYKIYYAADVHRIQGGQNTAANHADIVFAPASVILEQIDTRTQKIKIQHAVADYFFDPQIKVDLPGDKKRRKILYVGNLESKFLHFDLMREVISRNAECDFIFIGDAKKFQLSSDEFPNLWTVGEIKNTAVPSWLAAADVLWLCYDTDRFFEGASNAHKIMEYLSSGKVVVTTKIAEYINSDLLVMPDQNENLPGLMRSVVRNLEIYNAPGSADARINFARSNTYLKQVEIIDALLFEATEGK
jgi:hypothetical protein